MNEQDIDAEFEISKQLQIQKMQKLNTAQQQLDKARQNYKRSLDIRQQISDKSLEADNLQKLRVARGNLN